MHTLVRMLVAILVVLLLLGTNGSTASRDDSGTGTRIGPDDRVNSIVASLVCSPAHLRV